MTGWLLRILVTLIGSTLRWRVEDPSGLLAHTPQQQMIFAFWHNRIFLMPYLFRKHWSVRQRDRVAVLVSASRDGDKLACVLSRFNLVCVRGSVVGAGKRRCANSPISFRKATMRASLLMARAARSIASRMVSSASRN